MPPPFAEDDAGCWLWLRFVFPDGYGSWRLGETQHAHLSMYELLYGLVPPGLELHHTCEVRRCVNPAHLMAVTPAEHGRLHWKVECIHGHYLSESNTYVAPNGKRECRACRRQNVLNHRARRRAQATKET